MNFNTVARLNRAGTFNIAMDELSYTTLLDLTTLDLQSISIRQGLQEMYPRASLKIFGEYEIDTSEDIAAYYVTEDHLGVDQALFVGMLLASARMDEVNIAAALCKCIEYQLQRTAWYVLRDSNLSPEQQTIADEWRQEMMTLVTEETKIGDAVQRYTALIDENPEYDLRWKKSTKITTLESKITATKTG